jgi:TRAP-type C4-dicarboxylate transport system permease small subunit
MTWILPLIDRVIGRLCAVTEIVAGLAALLLLLLGTVDVVGTQAFGRAIPSAIELQEAFAAVLIFAGFVVAQRQRAHLTVDLVTGQLGRRGKVLAEGFGLACTIALFVLMTMQAGVLAERSWRNGEESPGFLSFPVYPFKIVACLACGLVVVESARQLLRVCLGLPAIAETAFDQSEILP